MAHYLIAISADDNRHGKTTLANSLVYEFQSIGVPTYLLSLATPIREAIQEVLFALDKNVIQMSVDDIIYQYKDTIPPGFTKTPRDIMISIATRLRFHDDDIFVNTLLSRLNKLFFKGPYKIAVVDDMRFANEQAAMVDWCLINDVNFFHVHIGTKSSFDVLPNMFIERNFDTEVVPLQIREKLKI